MNRNVHINLCWGIFKTRDGWCGAAWTPNGISALELPQKRKELAAKNLKENLWFLPTDIGSLASQSVPKWIQNETQKALAGKKRHRISVDLFFLTDFQRKVLQATLQIPLGQTRTYGWIASRAGSPRGCRAAGQALNRNPVSLLIPCHRVIAGGHRLGGYGGGLKWKIKLLKREKANLRLLTDGSYKMASTLIK